MHVYLPSFPPGHYRGAMLYLPKRAVYPERVRHDLNVTNASYWASQGVGGQTKKASRILLYREGRESFAVPRHYHPQWVEDPGLMRQWVCKSDTHDFEHVIKLRDEVQQDATAALSEPGDKILALGCGKGKTVCAIHSLSETKRFPALVVVNTNALMGQWKREIKKFMPGIKVGHIQQDICEWEGYPIAVAMLHTLVGKRFPKEFYKYWRLVMFDELHRLGAEYFMSACPMFPAERWGLTATLKRDDGMDRAIQYHVGKVAYENLDQPLKPTVYFIQTGLRVDENRFKARRSGWIKGPSRVNIPRLMTHLGDRPERNALEAYWMNRAVRQGRTVLILGERINYLETMMKLCKNRSKALLVGRIKKQEERDLALTKRVVVATQHLAKEGLDRPAFDTLIVSFPFAGGGRLRQTFGRILRELEGKLEPVVLVFEDEIGVVKSLCNKMRRHCAKLGFPVKNVRTTFERMQEAKSEAEKRK